MIDARMSAEQFEQIIAPLYRQFLGFLSAGEMALHMADRYRQLGHYPPQALVSAVDRALETSEEQKMPTIFWMRAQCNSWLLAQHGGFIPPKRRSEECALCVAKAGIRSDGRLAALHEPACVYYDSAVQPIAEQMA